jgi:hypothetical protein
MFRTSKSVGTASHAELALPRGRPCGARNKASLLIEQLLSGEAEELARKVITLAKAGDTGALKIAMDRLLPPQRDRPCLFKLPKLQTCSDAVAALAEIADGLARGRLLPSEAESLSGVVAAFVKTIELSNLEDRLAALEQARAEDLKEGPRYNA